LLRMPADSEDDSFPLDCLPAHRRMFPDQSRTECAAGTCDDLYQ
jgi:hypothetical protein